MHARGYRRPDRIGTVGELESGRLILLFINDIFFFILKQPPCHGRCYRVGGKWSFWRCRKRF
jgi:hypothetical protein